MKTIRVQRFVYSDSCTNDSCTAIRVQAIRVQAIRVRRFVYSDQGWGGDKRANAKKRKKKLSRRRCIFDEVVVCLRNYGSRPDPTTEWASSRNYFENGTSQIGMKLADSS